MYKNKCFCITICVYDYDIETFSILYGMLLKIFLTFMQAFCNFIGIDRKSFNNSSLRWYGTWHDLPCVGIQQLEPIGAVPGTVRISTIILCILRGTLCNCCHLSGF